MTKQQPQFAGENGYRARNQEAKKIIITIIKKKVDVGGARLVNDVDADPRRRIKADKKSQKRHLFGIATCAPSFASPQADGGLFFARIQSRPDGGDELIRIPGKNNK